MKTIQYFFAAFAFALLGAAVAWLPSAHAESLGFSLSQNVAPGTIQVHVSDDSSGKPISDAQVAIADLSSLGAGRSEFDPFSLQTYDHVLRTTSEGIVRFIAGSSATQVITVSHEGYSRITMIGVQGGQVAVQLKPLETKYPDVVASGEVGGWDARFHPEGKPVFLGLVFKTVGGLDLLHFNLTSVVSPIQDTIDIFGQRKIPSNLVMPKQDIPIFLGNVHVDKTHYRLPVSTGRPSRLSLIQGNIDSDDLVSIGSSGKISAAALNSFTFSSVGISNPLSPTGDFRLDLTPEYSLSNTAAHTVEVTKPPFKSDVIVAAVTDLNGDRSALLPTDLKSPLNSEHFDEAPKPVTLRSTEKALGQSRGILSVAATLDGKKLSGVIVDSAPALVTLGEFLNAPEIADSPALPATVSLPAPHSGLSAVIFEAEKPARRSGEGISFNLPRTYPTWYVYTLPVAGAVTLPTRSMSDLPATRLWSMVSLEFGNSFDERSFDGTTALKSLTRFTRSNAQIKK